MGAICSDPSRPRAELGKRRSEGLRQDERGSARVHLCAAYGPEVSLCAHRRGRGQDDCDEKSSEQKLRGTGKGNGRFDRTSLGVAGTERAMQLASVHLARGNLPPSYTKPVRMVTQMRARNDLIELFSWMSTRKSAIRKPFLAPVCAQLFPGGASNLRTGDQRKALRRTLASPLKRAASVSHHGTDDSGTNLALSKKCVGKVLEDGSNPRLLEARSPPTPGFGSAESSPAPASQNRPR